AHDFITPEVDRVLIDDGDEYEKVRDFMRLLGPQYLDRIETYSGGRKLFGDFHVEDEVNKLMRPKVNLPSGGSIVIETTEAFTVIDVNSGKFTGGKNLEETILKTNLEAAAEVARQVRLRDIGGIIVCDFIDMRRESSRNQVIETLERGLRRDRTRSTIQSFSALGLLEFTRKRVGKDLAQQLRAHCPTCNGLGTVLSPETVTIETFRKLRDIHAAHATGSAANGKPIHVISAPTVAAQMDFWYEDELHELAGELGTKIDVRVDPGVNPERPRIVTNGEAPTAPPLTVRVGDELEVEIVSARLPNPTSGLTVIDGRLVEVENAAGAVGQTMKVKILDIDEDEILAEPRTPAPGEEGARRKRRRGGRGRKRTLTAAEQVEELKRLAEEAAKGVGSRASIGISTAEEAETEAVAERTDAAKSSAEVFERRADAANVVGLAEAAPSRRRRRRRRRARHSVDEIIQTYAGEAAPAAPDAAEAEAHGEAVAPRIGADGEEIHLGGRRRRRRRRRRGRGRGAGVEGQTESGTVPERHIFRVDGEGAAYATGETAPREPSRAIAPVAPSRPPAIEPPPPSLSAPEEVAKPTRPSRRRRAAEDIEGTEIAALPAPKRRTRKAAAADAPASDEAEAPKKRTRKTAAAASANGETAAPKRTRKTSTTRKTSARKKTT
ncbi:MAG: ribonuclease E/G, partial [Candidatus Eremiobacteraeota bacterium]|nr:ribonuclease E/G [Candidatus Eremiobacteraeota bacterium]